MTYEGWENYETWNVALWINNEKPYYDKALKFMETHGDSPSAYMTFIENMGLTKTMTPDNVWFNDKTLNIKELDEMMQQFLTKEK
jgi:hypothetical protein